MCNWKILNFILFRLEVSSDLMSLHIGDRILEVNGTPIKDQPIESIENLIRYSDTVLQVWYIRNSSVLLHKCLRVSLC